MYKLVRAPCHDFCASNPQVYCWPLFPFEIWVKMSGKTVATTWCKQEQHLIVILVCKKEDHVPLQDLVSYSG